MVPWLWGMVLCLGLVAGCGGNKAAMVSIEPIPQEAVSYAAAPDSEETLAEELSAKRLEELYAKSGIPGWDPSLETELKEWDHQVKFDVPIQTNKQVRAYLVYFSTERKAVITRYLARSTRYLPMIKEVFQEYGLPEDLAFLAMIESGFNNKAYSPAAASGMWQFIKGTGLRYGLVIDNYVDERRDPEKATRAAARYLLDLYKQFGSWYLAAASYNCGEGRVQRELNTSNHKNFWDLSANMCLPTETKNYVPQMIAATIIAKNPEKFGFKNVPYLPAMKIDKVQVNEPVSLTAAAVAVNVPTEEVQALNPELLRNVTPPDTPKYTLNLPSNSKDQFAKNITIASIEHPAVATAPVRTARSAARSYQTSRSAAARQTAGVRKSGSKSRSYAAAPAKAAPAPEKSVASAPVKAAPAPVVQASLFGAPAPAAKTVESKKTPTAVCSPSKSKPKATAAKGRKTGEARLAKKPEHPSKTAAKSKKNTHRTKDKYSQDASQKSILVSEAR